MSQEVYFAAVVVQLKQLLITTQVKPCAARNSLSLHLQRCTCSHCIAMSHCVVFIRSVEALRFRRLLNSTVWSEGTVVN